MRTDLDRVGSAGEPIYNILLSFCKCKFFLVFIIRGVTYNKAIIKSGRGNQPVPPPTQPPLCAQTRHAGPCVRLCVNNMRLLSAASSREAKDTVLSECVICKQNCKSFRLSKRKRHRRTAGRDAPAARGLRICFCRQVRKKKINS